MFPPTWSRFWHGFAQVWPTVFSGFAMAASGRHCFSAGHRQSSPGLRSLRCYPSPSSRSGPSQAGPNLGLGQGVADCASHARNCFQIRDFAVESGAITTTVRGSFQCRSRLSSSLFSRQRSPAACRILHRVALPAQQPVPWWPMPPRATCLPGRSSVASQVSRPAASSLACRPAVRATERLTDLAAFGQARTTTGTIRADRSGGSFACPLGGADV